MIVSIHQYPGAGTYVLRGGYSTMNSTASTTRYTVIIPEHP